MNIRIVSVILIVGALGLATSADAQTAPPFTLSHSAYIKAATPGEEDLFGFAVALSADGTTLAVGAQTESSGAKAGDRAESAFASGAAYIYVQGPTGWVQQARLKASNIGASDQFGSQVALSADGNTLAVSAPYEDSAATGINGNQADNSMPEAGAVYVFTRAGTTWTQQAYVKASNTGEPDEGDTFGSSIALSGDGNTLAVGSPSEDSGIGGINANQQDNSSPGSGAVYVFTRSAASWSQQVYIKSPRPRSGGAAGDLFGYSVALSHDGSTLGVGVYDEAGASNVINGDLDFRANGTGAVYVYRRTGTAWTREAYLKARQQDRNDSMGNWIAISADGNTLAAAAADEDSMTTGVNAVLAGQSGITDAPDDNSSGAAYVFVREGTTWTQQASFKASNTGKNDWFGYHLALSGDGNTLAVAAPNEDGSATGIDGKDDDAADGAGAVYVFTRDGTTWSHRAYVKAPNTEAFDDFGSSVALNRDGKILAVGAKFEDGGPGHHLADNSVMDAGAVYVLVVGQPTESNR
jgi:hypothetical protein